MAADAIYQKISKNERIEYVDTLAEIKKMCRKTVRDLRAILGKLEEFQNELLLVDQNKRKMFCVILLKIERLSVLKFPHLSI